MARYGSGGFRYGGFGDYVSVASKKARAQTEVAALKKRGANVSPVLLEGRTIASTFWGKAWCENLERYSDFSNRLPRGRSYLRSGCVLDLQIERGRVTAQVQGTRTYRIEIDVDALPSIAWKDIVAECAGKVSSVVELLGGKLSSAVMDIVTREDAGLFPAPKQIHMTCSCPDGAYMCKHLAAVLYGIGARLDHRPELLFTLRHVDATELVSVGVAGLVNRAAPTTRKLDGDLGAIFGVDFVPDAESDRAPHKATRPSARSKAARVTRERAVDARPPAALTTPRRRSSTTAARASARTTTQAEIVDELRRTLDGVKAPFVCSGTLVPKSPIALRFNDGTSLPFRRTAAKSPSTLKRLIARSSPAPFGNGSKTLHDRRVRDGFQLKCDRGAFDVAGLDLAAIVDQVRKTLLPHDPNPLRADLYSVNAYAPGGHFQPHKDTPRGSDMVGTLVVCLPSRFAGGELVVTHDGAQEVIAWGEAIDRQAEPTRAHWAAFFGDVDHSIRLVRSGGRVTLSYILRRTPASRPTTAAAPAAAPRTELLREQLAAAVANPRFLRDGGELGFPCSHMYCDVDAFQRKRASLSSALVKLLKGRDVDVARAALDAGLIVSLRPYLVESDCAETWQLERFPRDDEQLDEQIDAEAIEGALPVARHLERGVDELGVTWVLPPPGPDQPGSAHVHSGEYSATGYFGNEGSDADFYVYAALHIAIPPLKMRRSPGAAPAPRRR